MKKAVFLFVIILTPFFSKGQGYDSKWLMGYASNAHTQALSELLAGNTLLDFRQNPVNIRFDSIPMNFKTAYASICNPTTGRLLFYTNGIYIADSTNAMMQNGDSINFDPDFIPNYNFWQVFRNGGYDDAGNAFVLPKPNSTTEFYLFHKTLVGYYLPEAVSILPDGILSHQIKQTRIDMTGNNGRGRVVSKNQPLSGMDSVTSFAAVKHANGRDWWIVGQQFRMQQFFIGLLTPNGFAYSHTQTFPNIYRRWYGASRGVGINAQFSPDGNKLAIGDLMNGTYLFDFDRCSGNLSNYRHIPNPDTLYPQGGACFSPNSRYLYSVTQFEYVHQYDTDAANLLSTDQIVARNDSFRYAPFVSAPNYYIEQYLDRPMLAPNGKIYITATGDNLYMGVIEQPDTRGGSCNVLQHNVLLPTFNRGTLPNYVNYRLGAMAGSSCDTLTVATNSLSPANKGFLTVFPNPTNGSFYLENLPEGASLQVYDMLGKSIAISTKILDNRVDISLLNAAAGVYFCRVSANPSGKNSLFFSETLKIIKN